MHRCTYETLRRFAGALALGSLALFSAASSGQGANQGTADAVSRGEYLVKAMGCNDCHTPWKMGPNGPEMDMARMLSGHPEGLNLKPPQSAAPPWATSVDMTFTAWAGPWGVSYTANLTPDPETGLGKWTEEDFRAAMKSGRHQGRGRQILPPMPWFNLAGLTDGDLSAVYQYLQSIPPIANKVPDPLPPAGGAASPSGGK